MDRVREYVVKCLYFGDEPELDELCRLLDIRPEDHRQ